MQMQKYDQQSLADVQKEYEQGELQKEKKEAPHPDLIEILGHLKIKQKYPFAKNIADFYRQIRGYPGNQLEFRHTIYNQTNEDLNFIISLLNREARKENISQQSRYQIQNVAIICKEALRKKQYDEQKKKKKTGKIHTEELASAAYLALTEENFLIRKKQFSSLKNNLVLISFLILIISLGIRQAKYYDYEKKTTALINDINSSIISVINLTFNDPKNELAAQHQKASLSLNAKDLRQGQSNSTSNEPQNINSTSNQILKTQLFDLSSKVIELFKWCLSVKDAIPFQWFCIAILSTIFIVQVAENKLQRDFLDLKTTLMIGLSNGRRETKTQIKKDQKETLIDKERSD